MILQHLKPPEIISNQYVRLSTGEQPPPVLKKHSPTSRQQMHLKGAVFCISHGYPGHNGELASEIACRNFIEDYYATPEYWSVKRSAYSVLDAINAWLHAQDRNSRCPGGIDRSDPHITAFTCLIIKGGAAHIFHIGDCRAYKLDDNRLTQLTLDHCLSRTSSHPYLIRALGLEHSVDIDYVKLPLEKIERFLLSCDDSLQSLSLPILHQCCNALTSPHGTEPLICEPPAHALLQVIVTAPGRADLDATKALLSLRSVPTLLKPGDEIDNYRVVEILVQGIRNQVYKVLNIHDQKYYVLKTPAREQRDNEAFIRGFILEAWIGQQLQHKNVMQMFAPTATTQYLYQIAEFVDGMTLREWMEEHPYCHIETARQLMSELIKPVRYLHRNDLLHRDLKPENFIITTANTVKLIDFGTVKSPALLEALFTQLPEEAPVGDIRYIAPEVLISGSSSNRSDLFSLACILYELLTGELPYSAILSNQDYPRHPDHWIYRPLAAVSAKNHPAPAWLDAVLKKALAPDPRKRYATLDEFEQALNAPELERLEHQSNLALIERDPNRFWKILSLTLLLMLLAETLYLVTH